MSCHSLEKFKDVDSAITDFLNVLKMHDISPYERK